MRTRTWGNRQNEWRKNNNKRQEMSERAFPPGGSGRSTRFGNSDIFDLTLMFQPPLPYAYLPTLDTRSGRSREARTKKEAKTRKKKEKETRKRASERKRQKSLPNIDEAHGATSFIAHQSTSSGIIRHPHIHIHTHPSGRWKDKRR